MEIPRALISLCSVVIACTTGASAVHAAGPPRYRKQNLSWHSDAVLDLCVSFGMSTEQTTDIELETPVYESGCSKQRAHTDSIEVDQWYGRVGNNLHQIVHAIFAAKMSGKSRVYTPLDWTSLDGTIRQLFNFSDRFDIVKDEEFRHRVFCQEKKGTHFFMIKCNGVRRSDYTNVLRTYLLPHLSDEARAACKREELTSENRRPELVIHLRSGDLLNPTSEDANGKKGRMAPCSFVDKVLEDAQGLERIRVITEPDMKHPCLPMLVEHGALVQSESVAADGCAFMYAEHLLLGAKSTFSEALSLFNPNPVTVYDPFGCVHHGHRGTTNTCPRGRGHAITYCIPGIDQDRSVESKMDWVIKYPRKKIYNKGTQCFD